MSWPSHYEFYRIQAVSIAGKVHTLRDNLSYKDALQNFYSWSSNLKMENPNDYTGLRLTKAFHIITTTSLKGEESTKVTRDREVMHYVEL